VFYNARVVESLPVRLDGSRYVAWSWVQRFLNDLAVARSANTVRAYVCCETTLRFFEKTPVLQARPLEEREDSQRDLVSYCTAIASASGGILGFGRVSPEEQRVLVRISQESERARGPLAGPVSPPGEARS
jgi:hypothetical protein